jgi:hypothetical protein
MAKRTKTIGKTSTASSRKRKSRKLIAADRFLLRTPARRYSELQPNWEEEEKRVGMEQALQYESLMEELETMEKPTTTSSVQDVATDSCLDTQALYVPPVPTQRPATAARDYGDVVISEVVGILNYLGYELRIVKIKGRK